MGERTLYWRLAIGERDGTQVHWKRKHEDLGIGVRYCTIVCMIMLSVAANCHYGVTCCHLPLRDWKRKVLSFLMIIFQRNGFQVLKKGIPGLQNWQEAGKLFTSQSGRERTITNFLK